MKYLITALLVLCCLATHAQPQPTRLAAKGTYTNPVLHMDYSDPDAIRVGNWYYMTASSFNAAPGLPLLRSNDLVHWHLMGYALPRLVPEEHFAKVRHGGGVWAPSLRHHKGMFYIFYPDPDFGIYMTRAASFEGPWSAPVLVMAGKGLIDPCPLWDDDGRAWLVYAYAGSRAGIKSVLSIKELAPDGTHTIGPATLIFDGHLQDETVEGPKIYKRNGWYYVLAPAGGVTHGWQLALRARHPRGPYERKVVLEQGSTAINGPHQGAWVSTPEGKHWFLHFQDKGAYGRIVHLQPVQWINDWPMMGTATSSVAAGMPVISHPLPVPTAKVTLPGNGTDEFETTTPNLLWQWQANPQETWGLATPYGYYRLFSVLQDTLASNLWHMPNLWCQKWPAESFTITTRLHPHLHWQGETAGLMIMGMDYAWLGIQHAGSHLQISMHTCKQAEKGTPEQVKQIDTLQHNQPIWLRVQVRPGALCTFSYSKNGTEYMDIDVPFTAQKGKWVGAKTGLFVNRNNITNNAGYVDVQWWRVQR